MAPVFDPFRLASVSLDVLAAGRAGPGALAARQRARLARLRETIVRASRFYREHLAGIGPEVPLAELPPVTRQALMARFDDWVTDPQLRLADLKAFTADPDAIGQAYLGRYVVWESSGTSHQPGVFVQDAATMAVYDALEALRSDGSNAEARATFERHRADLGYGLLLTPHAKEIGKADESAIAKAVDDSIPQVAPLFWSFRLMVGIGVVLLGLFAAAFLQLCRGKLVQSPRLLKALFWSIPLPWIAIEAGWFVAEFGRQPWTISDVLPVSASVSLLQPGQLWFSLISIFLIYSTLLVVELFLLRHVIRKGPASLQTGRYQGEVLKNGSPV